MKQPIVYFSPENRRLFLDGKIVMMPKRQFEMAFLLGNRAGRDVPFAELWRVYQPMIPYRDADHRHLVTTAIKRIRQAINKACPGYNPIKIYIKFGYRWEVKDAVQHLAQAQLATEGTGQASD